MLKTSIPVITVIKTKLINNLITSLTTLKVVQDTLPPMKKPLITTSLMMNLGLLFNSTKIIDSVLKVLMNLPKVPITNIKSTNSMTVPKRILNIALKLMKN